MDGEGRGGGGGRREGRIYSLQESEPDLAALSKFSVLGEPVWPSGKALGW